MVSRFEGPFLPSILGHLAGAGTFTHPILDIAAAVLHCEEKPDMRIDPLEVGDLTFKLGLVVAVIHRIRMVRDDGAGGNHAAGCQSENRENLPIHCAHSCG